MNQKQAFQKQIQNTCKICTNDFNLHQNISFTVCPLSHTLCLVCIKRLRPLFICPFCRLQIQPNKMILNKPAVEILTNDSGIIDQLQRVKFKRKRGRIIIEGNLSEAQMQQPTEFMLKIVQKITNYVIPFIYALQILTFISQIALEFSEDQCLNRQITDDSLTLRKYIKMDLGVTEMLTLLVILAYLITKIQSVYLQDIQSFVLSVVLKLFFFTKFILDCFLWFHIIYLLQLKCSWLIKDVQIAQLIIRCGIIIFFVILGVQIRLTIT